MNAWTKEIGKLKLNYSEAYQSLFRETCRINGIPMSNTKLKKLLGKYVDVKVEERSKKKKQIKTPRKSEKKIKRK